MYMYMKKHTFILDSRDRNATSSNEHPHFDIRSIAGNQIDIHKLEIKYVSIPFSYYLIDASNNKIDYTNNTGNTYTATITTGFYSGSTLATEIEAQLEANDADLEGYTVSYSDATGKFTIANNAGNYSLLWNSGTNTSTNITRKFNAVGFDNSSNDTGASSYTSDYIARLSGEDYLLLCSDELRPDNKTIYRNTAGRVLARIPVNVNAPDTIGYEPSTEYIFDIEGKYTNIDFEIRDRHGALNLNGTPWLIEVNIY